MALSIQLTKQDLLQVSAVSSRSSMILLPPTAKSKHRVVVTDSTGLVHCFSVKRGVVETDFKTHLQHNGSAAAVDAVALGGAVGNRDKIFVSSGSTVRGFTRKGKEFFEMRTNLSESLHHMAVEDVHLYGGGVYIYNHFDNGADKDFVMLPDRINCLAIDRVSTASTLSPMAPHDVFLGCADRTIRMVTGSQIKSEVAVEGPVTSICCWEAPTTPAALASIPAASRPAPGTRFLVYGCSTGHVGLVSAHASTGLAKCWSFTSPVSDGGVNSITCFPIGGAVTGSAAAASPTASSSSSSSDCLGDLVIGRDDGSVEVYAGEAEWVATSNAASAFAPRLLGSTTVSESIRCVGAGYISTATVPEVIVLTFSGRVVSFTTERLTEVDREDREGRSKEAVQRSSALAALRKDVDDLKKEISKAREKAGLSKAGTSPTAASSGSASSSQSNQGPVTIAAHPINTTFALDTTDGTYCLTIEMPVPIDSVMIQSTVPVGLPDIENKDGGGSSNAGAGAAMASLSANGQQQQAGSRAAPNIITSSSNSTGVGCTTILSLAHVDSRPVPGAPLLATARCAENAATNRIAVRMKCIEGQAGEVTAMVVTRGQPKASSLARVQIKPLCLHHRLQERPEDVQSRLQEQWSAFLAQRRAEHEADAATAAAAAEGGDGDHDGGGGSSAAAAKAGPTSAGDSDVNAITAALAAVSKAATDPKALSAAALALSSQTPLQTAQLRSLPAAHPWTTLTITGAFSLPQMHEWAGQCLPDIPPRLIADGKTEAVSLAFRNVFVGSHVLVSYRAGTATFKSDNVSTISILRDCISAAAGAAKVRISASFEVAPLAARCLLSLLHGRLVYALTLNLKAQLYEAVKEMVAADNTAAASQTAAGSASLLDRPYLHPEFADVLANGDRYASEAKSVGSSSTDMLFGCVADAFGDAAKLRGVDVTARIPQLMALLPRYHLQVEAPGQLQQQYKAQRGLMRGSEVVALFMERG